MTELKRRVNERWINDWEKALLSVSITSNRSSTYEERAHALVAQEIVREEYRELFRLARLGLWAETNGKGPNRCDRCGGDWERCTGQCS